MDRPELSGPANIISWLLQLLAAVVLIQTIYFKFSGAEETIYIFKTVGMEPWGRYVSGVFESIAALLLLYSRTSWAGALVGLCVISTAIYFHFTKLGIEVMGDGGALFYLASTVAISCLGILYLRRKQAASDIRSWMRASETTAEP